jgi:hypothetical protein
MLSCNDNILVSLTSVIMFLPSDVTRCSNVGYYRGDKCVFIIRLRNVPLTQLLFINTKDIVSNLSLFLPPLVHVFFSCQ